MSTLYHLTRNLGTALVPRRACAHDTWGGWDGRTAEAGWDWLKHCALGWSRALARRPTSLPNRQQRAPSPHQPPAFACQEQPLFPVSVPPRPACTGEQPPLLCSQLWVWEAQPTPGSPTAPVLSVVNRNGRGMAGGTTTPPQCLIQASRRVAS